jgi:IclR family acetate operon transcriptional repressor
MASETAESAEAEGARSGAQAVERAVALLRCFDGNAATISLTELAQRTGLRVSTAHRIVRALVRGDLLDQDPMTERYRLGRAFAILGQAAMAGFGFHAARPELVRLAEATGEAASLGLRDGVDVVVALTAPSSQPLRFDQPAGTRLDLHASAMGKVLLAFADPDLKATVATLGPLVRYTDATITRRATLLRELRAIRDRGFAPNLEERYVGVSGLAAPVLDADGQARAAVGIRGPAARLDAPRMEVLAPQVIATARLVATLLPLDRF